MLELDSTVVKEGPHEAARRRPEPVATELDEGDHVAFRRDWFPMFRWRRDPLRPHQRSKGAEEPLPLQILQPALHHG